MAAFVIGRETWDGQRDSMGYRTWNVCHKVRTTDPADGPQVVMDCAGLPYVGSVYSDLASSNDVDPWAYCWPDMQIQMLEQRADNTGTWEVKQKFSTQPMARCNSVPVGNPLLEPQKIGGNFVRYLKQATHDMYNTPILSSSWEVFVGKEVEFEEVYPTVWVEQNVATLGLSDFSQYVNCVNDSVLWGLGPRCVKLSNVTWTRNIYGICNFYYTRRFEFDINYNTFDRIIQDKGTKVLNGHFGSPGSGCTINVTTVDKFNAITGFTIGSAGTGYPTSQTIALAVTGGTTGEGATVNVTTDGSGVVNGVGVVVNGGTGYTAGDTGLATTGSGWVLDKIGGKNPDKNNPQHFIRYKDRRGECVSAILDGSGQPAINKYPGYFLVQKYQEQNLLELGIPPYL